MDNALPDACVTGYQRLIPALTLSDPDDRHVLAAAIRAKAQVIVTFNEKDVGQGVGPVLGRLQRGVGRCHIVLTVSK